MEIEEYLTCMDDLFNGFQIMLFQYLGNREEPRSYFRDSLKAGIGNQKRKANQIKFQIPPIHHNQGSSTAIRCILNFWVTYIMWIG